MINGISNSGPNYYSQIASGSRIQRAADDAAGLAIVQHEEGQIRGYDMGTRNAEDGVSALNVADGAVASITDSLQRVRELALQASNTATMTADDRQAIQDEISQLLSDIDYTAGNTQFNTRNLLDGSNNNMHIASSPDGSGMNVNTGTFTLQSLGLQNFDVTGNFSISTIDNALEMVSSSRSSIGAQTNSLDYTIGYNRNTSYNLTAAQSRIGDTDIEKAVTEQNKKTFLQTARFMMQKKQMEQEKQKYLPFM